MTVKDELMLLAKGYSRNDIKEMKEREALETTPAEEPEKVVEPEKTEEVEEVVKPEKVEEDENVSRETLEKDNRIKELETQLAKVQEENVHRDNSGEVDSRTDFEKCVDIFRNAIN